MKGSYRRYAKAGAGGIKCPCCGGKHMQKYLEKRIAKRNFNRITDLLVDDEVALLMDETALVNGTVAEQLEAEAEIERLRYEAYIGNTEYPDEFKYWYPEYGCFDDSRPDYINSAYDNSYDDKWFRDERVVMGKGEYGMTEHNTGIYHLARRWTFVGAIREYDFHWEVDFLPTRGGQTRYQMNKLDATLESCMDLLIMLDKMDDSGLMG